MLCGFFPSLCQQTYLPLFEYSLFIFSLVISETNMKLEGICLHFARHTLASLMFKQRVHPKAVKEPLGHASIQISLDTYSHIAPGLQETAANCFDEVVLIKPKESQKEFSR
jgi:integrase